MLVPALYNRSSLETIVYIMPIGSIMIFFNPLTTIYDLQFEQKRTKHKRLDDLV